MLTTVFVLWNGETTFLGAFAKIAKNNYQFSHACLCLCVFRTERLGSHWTDFREISYSSPFRKSERNDEPFT
jgi:hypothetical protein